MPAERTKNSKRSTDSTGERVNQIAALSATTLTHLPPGNEFFWSTQLLEPTNDSEVAFTPNMTSIAFTDLPPPLVDAPPTEFILFPPPDDSSPPRRPAHTKKKPENHIPRPPNAFILFRSSFIKSQHVSTEVETNHSTLSKIIGLTWQNLPEEERQLWHTKAKEALNEHKRKFPKYAFRPVQTKAKGAASEKRKVREVEPKDIKRCTKIAQLLVEGKKGHELDAAIQEFDKHHVPEIVTRFEAPITARAYRRSSSAPIPDTESSRAAQPFLQDVASTRKPRATSTLPTRCATPESEEVLCPAVNAAVFPLKQEASFVSPALHGPKKILTLQKQNFGDFSFDNVASPFPMYDCDPLSVNGPDSYHEIQYDQRLTIDTSFMSDWAPSPSPHSPETPNYLMTPSPMLDSSPTPSFTSGFGGSFDETLDRSFGFSSHFSTFDSQSCGMQQTMSMYDGGVNDSLAIATESLYNVFDDRYHHDPNVSIMDLGLEFSAFMNSVPQYAM
jgi:HMG (high mobility group) box